MADDEHTENRQNSSDRGPTQAAAAPPAPPIVVTSEQLDEMRNPSAPRGAPVPTNAKQPPITYAESKRRALIARGRVRIAYEPNGQFVIVVGEGESERILPDNVYRFALIHNAPNQYPTLALWLYEPDAAGSMSNSAPLDVPEAEILDVELLKQRLRDQLTTIALAVAEQHHAVNAAIRLTMIAMGVGFQNSHGYSRTELPGGVDPAAIADNAHFEARGVRMVARPMLGDALAKAQLAMDNADELLATYTSPSSEEVLALTETRDALGELILATGWLAVDTANMTARPNAEHNDAVVAEMMAESNAEAAAAAHDRERAAIATAKQEAARASVAHFAEWLVGAHGPPIMQAKTAAQAESRAGDLVAAYQQYVAEESAAEDRDGGDS